MHERSRSAMAQQFADAGAWPVREVELELGALWI
jgi:hypothetical protein